MSIHNVERRIETALKNLEEIDITKNKKISKHSFIIYQLMDVVLQDNVNTSTHLKILHDG